MEFAAAVDFVTWPLARCSSAGAGLTPRALPIWAVEPCFGIAFNNSKISTVHRVLVYPVCTLSAGLFI